MISTKKPATLDFSLDPNKIIHSYMNIPIFDFLLKTIVFNIAKNHHVKNENTDLIILELLRVLSLHNSVT